MQDLLLLIASVLCMFLLWLLVCRYTIYKIEEEDNNFFCCFLVITYIFLTAFIIEAGDSIIKCIVG